MNITRNKEFIELYTLATDDVMACMALMRRLDYPFVRRAYVRSALAYFEATVFSIKRFVLAAGASRVSKLTDCEIALLSEKGYSLDGFGNVQTKPTYQRILPNLRFAFSMLTKVYGTKAELDMSGAGGAAFKNAVKIRNRLMHPKIGKDLFVHKKEVVLVTVAFQWFVANVAFLLKSIIERQSNELRDLGSKFILNEKDRKFLAKVGHRYSRFLR